MDKFVLQRAEVEHLARELENAHPSDIIRVAVEQIPKLTFACSFGSEDMVILHLLMNVDRNAHVFYLDTDLLFPETYAVRDIAVQRYGLPNLKQVRTELSVAEQNRLYGDALWGRDPNACCNLRKVQPLTSVLQQYEGWITGIRRQQSPTRQHAKVFEYDSRFGLFKINPLAMWTDQQVWDFIHEHDIPYNPLHDQGYPSIGCIHCTKPVNPGNDPRSGRWAGFEKTECGLHR